MNEQKIKQAYELAVERYASLGVDVEKAMELLGQVSLSMHCWQARCPEVSRLQVTIRARLATLMNFVPTS